MRLTPHLLSTSFGALPILDADCTMLAIAKYLHLLSLTMHGPAETLLARSQRCAAHRLCAWYKRISQSSHLHQ